MKLYQHWSRFHSEDDEGNLTHGWRYKAGRSLDKLGTVAVIPCDSEGWINLADHEPDPETHSQVQVIRVWHDPKTEDSVGTMRVLIDHVTQGFYIPGIGDGFKWRLWQPMGNLPNEGESSTMVNKLSLG